MVTTGPCFSEQQGQIEAGSSAIDQLRGYIRQVACYLNGGRFPEKQHLPQDGEKRARYHYARELYDHYIGPSCMPKYLYAARKYTFPLSLIRLSSACKKVHRVEDLSEKLEVMDQLAQMGDKSRATGRHQDYRKQLSH